MPANKIILLGIGGGIAAYKAVEVASTLFKAGHETHVAMSPAAQKFITPLTFSAVTNRPVISDLFPNPVQDRVEDIYPHLFPATKTDIFVLLPATADQIARISVGIGDDIVSTCALSLPPTCARYFCPSMNVEMWNQKVVQRNVSILENLGWYRIGPMSGHLACGAFGQGRIADPDDIVRVILQDIDGIDRLAGKSVLILSGPTIEAIDPVRFISNKSSGKMGKSLADAAAGSGAKVTFITGPVSSKNLPNHGNTSIINVTTADDMLTAAEKYYSEADAVVYVAAVCDYKPDNPAAGKAPKKDGGFLLPLKTTPDIAATLNAKKNARQVCIGFALETDEDAVDKARNKLARKHLDAIILNGIDSFASEEGQFTIIRTEQSNKSECWGRIDKQTCADRIIGEISRLLEMK